MRLAVADLAKSYPGLTVLEGLELNVDTGEVVAIRGASGTGKSTLLHCLGLIDRPDRGTIHLDGDDLTTLGPTARATVRARRIGFVFQAFHLLPEFNVLENVLMSARTAGLDLGPAQQRACELLREVGLAGHAGKDVRTLSGGERQRVALCRALLPQPHLLLADEPTGNLDSKSGKEILEIFDELNRRGKTLIMVTHDESIARRGSRAIRIRDGQVESDQRF